MWKKYKRRVLLAMSSQAFAQLVCYVVSLTAWLRCLLVITEWYQWWVERALLLNYS